MNDAGKVTGIPRGEYDASVMYERLDIVRYNNAVWMAKKNAKGVTPAEGDYWMLCISQLVDDALKPDSVNAIQNKVVCAALDEKPSIVGASESHITGTVEAPMLVTKATVNLLNPTLATTTQNGVTCTKNSDGTYTLNGTNTSDTNTFFIISPSDTVMANSLTNGMTYKVIGIPKSFGDKVCVDLAYWRANYAHGKSVYDTGNGNTFTKKSALVLVRFSIAVKPGVTVSNVLIKPMLTTDLSATYDDFVPYDGYEIKSCGKNLLDPNAVGTYDSPHSENGVTFTKNNDGSWTINGTATANVGVSIGYPGGDHTLIELEADAKAFLYGPSGLSGVSYGFYSNEGKQVLNDGIIPKGTKVRNLWISADIGSTLNNVKVFGVISYDLNLTNKMYVPYQDGGTVQITPSTEFPLLGLKSFDGETNIISPGNVEVAYAKNDSGKAILGMVKPTVKNLVSTVEGNPLDATMGAQLKKEIDELKAKVDAMSTSTTTE